MPKLPSGTVTFLFTDIAGSTRLWQTHAEAMQRVYARHDAILRSAIASHHGVVYKVIGDAVQAAFPSAPEAVAAAVAVQHVLLGEDWAALGLPEPLRVRMALHAGAVEPDPDGDYRSPVLNRLGRLLSTGYGGQVLLSAVAAVLAREALPVGVTLRDLGSHRLKDLREPEPIFQLLSPGLPADFPSLQTLDPHRHNLPVQPTPLVGREIEVATVVELMRHSEVRLLTLTGPGGTGKTRLGVQAAAELINDFRDGACFVPLAGVTDPELVQAAIGEALQVREAGNSSLLDQVRELLAEKAMLLILDSFEHLLPAASVVSTLVNRCPDVKLLVTSRTPLRLRGEREYAVAPLALPRRRPPPSLAQLTQYEAVRLFIERALAVRADFAVDNMNAPAVAEICHRLDGLPLAIELAAARVRLLPPQSMLARLEHRLSFATSGPRDLPERQRTLRHTIAWSYDLLEPEERLLFRRLAIFAGGGTLEAAEVVATWDLELDVLTGVERLLEHNLLRSEAGSGADPRFTMLETIREFGLEALAESGEATVVAQRHAHFFLQLVERAAPSLVIGKVEGHWPERLEAEHDNLRAALTWSAVHDSHVAQRLVVGMTWFWWLHGHLSEGRRWLERSKDNEVLRARALAGAAMLAESQGDDEQAAALAGHAIADASATNDVESLVWALNVQASAMGNLGDADAAHSLYDQALAGAYELGDPRWIAIVLFNLAGYALDMEKIDAAIVYLEQGVGVARSLGPSGLLGAYLARLSYIQQRRGDDDRAEALRRESLALALEAGDRNIVVETLENYALTLRTGTSATQAARFLGATESARVMMNLRPRTVSEQTVYAQTLANVRKRLGEAVFAAAWDAGWALPLEQAVAEALGQGDSDRDVV